MSLLKHLQLDIPCWSRPCDAFSTLNDFLSVSMANVSLVCLSQACFHVKTKGLSRIPKKSEKFSEKFSEFPKNLRNNKRNYQLINQCESKCEPKTAFWPFWPTTRLAFHQSDKSRHSPAYTAAPHQGFSTQGYSPDKHAQAVSGKTLHLE